MAAVRKIGCRASVKALRYKSLVSIGSDLIPADQSPLGKPPPRLSSLLASAAAKIAPKVETPTEPPIERTAPLLKSRRRGRHNQRRFEPQERALA
jgi:hypothetical protein